MDARGGDCLLGILLGTAPVTSRALNGNLLNLLLTKDFGALPFLLSTLTGLGMVRHLSIHVI